MDRSIIDALSWRLASELFRRHPDELTVNLTHPGGGMYDCLDIRNLKQPRQIVLNRNGTIQIHGPFAGGGESEWHRTDWRQYSDSDPDKFLLKLEAAAGLSPPTREPEDTPESLTYRVIAQITALSIKTTHPYQVDQGFVDSSGDDAGPNPWLDAFPQLAEDLSHPRSDDLLKEPRYRY